MNRLRAAESQPEPPEQLRRLSVRQIPLDLR